MSFPKRDDQKSSHTSLKTTEDQEQGYGDNRVALTKTSVKTRNIFPKNIIPKKEFFVCYILYDFVNHGCSSEPAEDHCTVTSSRVL